MWPSQAIFRIAIGSRRLEPEQAPARRRCHRCFPRGDNVQVNRKSGFCREIHGGPGSPSKTPPEARVRERGGRLGRFTPALSPASGGRGSINLLAPDHIPRDSSASLKPRESRGRQKPAYCCRTALAPLKNCGIPSGNRRQECRSTPLPQRNLQGAAKV